MSRSAPRVSVGLVFLCVAASATPLHAQRRQAELPEPASMRIQISDRSGAAVPDVTIEVAGIAGITTDSAGRAFMQGITPGRQLVRVARYGFRTETLLVDFEPAALVEMDAVLQPGVTALQLAPLMVDGRITANLLMRGFEHRKRIGIGTFMEREEISRWDHLEDLTFVFRRLPGFNVRLRGGAEFELVSSRAGGCPPQFMLDGSPSSLQVISALAPHHVEAIEAYGSQATTPPQFLRSATGGSCGTVVVWTRTGRRR